MRGHFPKRLILMSFLVISTCLAGCEKKNAIESEVTAVVLDKQYQESYVTYTADSIFGKRESFAEEYHEARYLVLICYCNDEGEKVYETIDDLEFYNSCQKDDEVIVTLCEWEDFLGKRQKLKID